MRIDSDPGHNGGASIRSVRAFGYFLGETASCRMFMPIRVVAEHESACIEQGNVHNRRGFAASTQQPLVVGADLSEYPAGANNVHAADSVFDISADQRHFFSA